MVTWLQFSIDNAREPGILVQSGQIWALLPPELTEKTRCFAIELGNECMRLKDYDNDDGKRVWLSDDELTRFIEQAETPLQRLAFLLAGRVELRRSDIIEVCPQASSTDRLAITSESGRATRSGTEYREPPVSAEAVHRGTLATSRTTTSRYWTWIDCVPLAAGS